MSDTADQSPRKRSVRITLKGVTMPYDLNKRLHKVADAIDLSAESLIKHSESKDARIAAFEATVERLGKEVDDHREGRVVSMSEHLKVVKRADKLSAERDRWVETCKTHQRASMEEAAELEDTANQRIEYIEELPVAEAENPSCLNHHRSRHHDNASQPTGMGTTA